MKEELIAERLDLTNLWNQMLEATPGLTTTVAGKELEKRYKDALEDYSSLLANVDKMQDDAPTATQVIDRTMAIRQNDAFQDIPDVGKKQVAFFTGPVGSKMLELASLIKNPEGVNLGNEVALAQQSYVTQAFPEMFDPANPEYDTYQQMAFFKSTGALQIPPGASAGAIQTVINQVQKNPNNTFVIPTRTVTEQTVMALRGKDMHLELLRAAQSTMDTTPVELANAGLLGVTYSLSYLNDGEQPPNVRDDMLIALADGSLDHAVNVSLSGASLGERQAFADEAEQFYRSTNPEERKQEIRNYYKEWRIGGVGLSELVYVDPMQIENNVFSWNVDDEMLDRAARERVSQQVSADITGNKLVFERRQVEKQINEAMAKIQREMDQQIRIEMTINKAKANDPNSMRMADEWASHFLGAGDPTANTHAWANLFNYSEGTVTRER